MEPTAAAPTSWTEPRLRLWHALGLGPAWRDRRRTSGAPQAGASGEACAQLPAAAIAGAAALPVVDRDPQALHRLWDGLTSEVLACRACGLCQARQQAVVGVGGRQATVMVVGEGPGAEEDLRGEPFVGQAGRLLDNMLAAIGLSRAGEAGAAVYIANVVKCRPPGNRNPAPDEIAACDGFLRRQIALVQPRLLVAVGKFAAQALLGSDAPVGALRGRVHPGNAGTGGIPVVVTWHPAYLLRTPADKARAWADLCLAREALDA